MKFERDNDSSQRGFSLLELLVVLGVMSVAGAGLLRLLETNTRANRSNELRGDLLDVRKTITEKISCENTLGLTRPSTCAGPQELKDKFGKVLAPKGKIGVWDIEAVCETKGNPPRNGLSVYAIRKKDEKNFMLDPLRNLPWNRDHPDSSLFDLSNRLCPEHFGWPKVAECPFKIASINFEDRTVVCTPLNIADCPPKEFLTGVVDDVRTCAPAPICKAFFGRATGAGNQGGAGSPNEDCQNHGGVPGADWGGYIKYISNRYCMSPHSTSKSYGQHGDCSNRGGKGKCGCWSCQADGVECYYP